MSNICEVGQNIPLSIRKLHFDTSIPVCILFQKENVCFYLRGQDYVFSTATSNGLNGSGFLPRWMYKVSSPHSLDRPWGPPSFLFSEFRVSFLSEKRPWRDSDNPPTLAPRLRTGRAIYLVSHCALLGFYWAPLPQCYCCV